MIPYFKNGFKVATNIENMELCQIQHIELIRIWDTKLYREGMINQDLVSEICLPLKKIPCNIETLEKVLSVHPSVLHHWPTKTTRNVLFLGTELLKEYFGNEYLAFPGLSHDLTPHPRVPSSFFSDQKVCPNDYLALYQYF